jgi:hypothetical protein
VLEIIQFIMPVAAATWEASRYPSVLILIWVKQVVATQIILI